MIWPDMLWMWIIAYDLWNFAYTYNCMSDHSTYTGLALLIACTVPRSSRSVVHGYSIARKPWRSMRCSPWRSRSSIRLRKFPRRITPLRFCRKSDCVDFQRGACRLPAPSIRARKLNPLKDELYNDTKKYREVVEENR